MCKCQNGQAPQLMEAYKGNISIETGKSILSDLYDVWLMNETPSTRTVEGHYELDPNPYPNRQPFKPMEHMMEK